MLGERGGEKQGETPSRSAMAAWTASLVAAGLDGGEEQGEAPGGSAMLDTPARVHPSEWSLGPQFGGEEQGETAKTAKAAPAASLVAAGLDGRDKTSRLLFGGVEYNCFLPYLSVHLPHSPAPLFRLFLCTSSSIPATLSIPLHITTHPSIHPSVHPSIHPSISNPPFPSPYLHTQGHMALSHGHTLSHGHCLSQGHKARGTKRRAHRQ